MEWIFEPWPWYIGGPLVAFCMIALLLAGKNFGVSSNFRTICAACGAGKTSDFFKFDWKAQRWNLLILIGAVLGGYVGAYILSDGAQIPAIHPDTITKLHELGFQSAGKAYAPAELYDTLDLRTLALLLTGGLLVGFGSRYAGGCTSGHAISGLSDLQLPSLIAVVGFFIGGLLMVHVIFPVLF